MLASIRQYKNRNVVRFLWWKSIMFALSDLQRVNVWASGSPDYILPHVRAPLTHWNVERTLTRFNTLSDKRLKVTVLLMGTFISPVFYVLTWLFALSTALHYASFLSRCLPPFPFASHFSIPYKYFIGKYSHSDNDMIPFARIKWQKEMEKKRVEKIPNR